MDNITKLVERQPSYTFQFSESFSLALHRASDYEKVAPAVILERWLRQGAKEDILRLFGKGVIGENLAVRVLGISHIELFNELRQRNIEREDYDPAETRENWEYQMKVMKEALEEDTAQRAKAKSGKARRKTV